jgi:hypothetical protein
VDDPGRALFGDNRVIDGRLATADKELEHVPGMDDPGQN